LRVSKPNVILSPWQIDSAMESVALGLTERLRVITESHPLVALMVRLYVPAVLSVSKPKDKLSP
jgi:hypothetical protein